MKRYFFLILLYTNTLIAGVSLFPEDGSQKIKRWFYSPHKIKDMYKISEWQEVLNTFNRVGIKPINSKIGYFFQDLAFFSSQGELILQHFPKYDYELTPNYEFYFKGFTMEIFTPPDWGTDYEVNLLTRDTTKHLETKTHQLDSTFIEGGASISGRFSNGDNYLLVNHSSFLGMKTYYQDLSHGQMTDAEIIHKIEKDLSLKAGNFIYLKGTSHIHLDRFMKALPGGVILIDQPEAKLSILKNLRKSSQNTLVDSYINYEMQEKYSFYKTAVKRAQEQLEKRFKVVPIAGSFTQMFTNVNGVTSPVNDINFFNGVSGIYKKRHFYITNKAKFIPELESFWTTQMRKFDIHEVYFPGVYWKNAGLDCMGSPAP